MVNSIPSKLFNKFFNSPQLISLLDLEAISSLSIFTTSLIPLLSPSQEEILLDCNSFETKDHLLVFGFEQEIIAKRDSKISRHASSACLRVPTTMLESFSCSFRISFICEKMSLVAAQTSNNLRDRSRDLSIELSSEMAFWVACS
ncbi:unnamed protein product [Linum tenue]|uniref:Uncharacterized protein n=1 Tax=Linum tenue TaxID=586396 RepID=A0AAV0LMC9_9ROSI|nr:unnamed protein product [Linum tenue]